MEFYSDGVNIGVVFSGIGGLLLLIYIALVIVNFGVTRTFLSHKIFLYFRVRKQLKKIIPSWWVIKKVDFLTLKRSSFGRKDIYVYVERDIPGYPHRNTSSWVTMNNFGKIIDIGTDLRIYDEELNDGVKLTYNRNKVLEELGI